VGRKLILLERRWLPTDALALLVERDGLIGGINKRQLRRSNWVSGLLKGFHQTVSCVIELLKKNAGRPTVKPAWAVEGVMYRRTAMIENRDGCTPLH